MLSAQHTRTYTPALSRALSPPLPPPHRSSHPPRRRVGRAERTGEARVVHMTSEARKIPYQALNPVYLGRNQGHLGGDGNLLQMMTMSGPKWSRYQQVPPSHWRTSFPRVVSESRAGPCVRLPLPTVARAGRRKYALISCFPLRVLYWRVRSMTLGACVPTDQVGQLSLHIRAQGQAGGAPPPPTPSEIPRAIPLPSHYGRGVIMPAYLRATAGAPSCARMHCICVRGETCCIASSVGRGATPVVRSWCMPHHLSLTTDERRGIGAGVGGRGLQARGSRVKALLAHPGGSATNLQVTTMERGGLLRSRLAAAALWGFKRVAMSAEDGAVGMLRCMAQPGLVRKNRPWGRPSQRVWSLVGRSHYGDSHTCMHACMRRLSCCLMSLIIASRPLQG